MFPVQNMCGGTVMGLNRSEFLRRLVAVAALVALFGTVFPTPADAGGWRALRKLVQPPPTIPHHGFRQFERAIPQHQLDEMAAKGLPRWFSDAHPRYARDNAEYWPIEIDELGNIKAGPGMKTIEDPRDLTRLLQGPDRRKILIRETDVFDHRTRLFDLLGENEFVMWDGKRLQGSRAVLRKQDGDLFVQVEETDGLWVEARTRDELADTGRLLDDRVATGEVDVATFFDSREHAVLGSFDEAIGIAHQKFSAGQGEKLLRDVASGRNRTIIVVSHVENGQAVIRNQGGQVADRISLDALQQAADGSDNNLIFLGCETATSAVRGFRAPVRTRPIAATLSKIWQDGQFSKRSLLSSLGQQGDGFVVSGKNIADGRRKLIAQTRGEVLADGVTISAVRLNHISASREQEFEHRIVSWLPTNLHWPFLISLILLAFSPKLAWRSWNSINPSGKRIPKGLQWVVVTAGFLTVGLASLASIRIIAFGYSVVTQGGWRGGIFGLVLFLLFGSAFVIMVPLYMIIYYAMTWKSPADAGWDRMKNALAFGGYCLVWQAAILSVTSIPILFFEVDNVALVATAMAASWVAGLAAAIITKLKTSETPSEILARLWGDPFWPVRQLQTLPQGEAT